MNKKVAFVIIAFAIGMTNVGLTSNLWYTFSCLQYYLDYLIFFTLGFVLLKGIQSGLKLQKSKLLLSMLTIIGIFLFDILYRSLTGCEFSLTFFLSSKTPIASAFATSLIFLIPNVERVKEHWIKTIDGTKLFIKEDEILYVELKNCIARINTNSMSDIMISDSLKTIKELISPNNFYQANRNFVVSRGSIRKIIPISGKGITVTLNNGQEISVNKNRTSQFKKWLNH